MGRAAAKARIPLIAGGTAIVGAAAGVALRERLASRSKNPLKRLGGLPAPKVPKAARPDLAKLDIKTVKSVADQVTAYGRQASDIASAIEKTRKENKQ